MTTPQFKTFIPSEAPSWYTSKSWDEQFKDDMKKCSFNDLRKWVPYLWHVSEDVLKKYNNKDKIPGWFRNQIDTELGLRKGGKIYMRYLSQFTPSILTEIHEKIGFVTLANIFLKVGPKLVEFTSMFRALRKDEKKQLIDKIENTQAAVKAKLSSRNGFEPTEGMPMLEHWAMGYAIYLALVKGLTPFQNSVLLLLLVILNRVSK